MTSVVRASNYEWGRLLWLLYDRAYVLQEAWEWEVGAYRAALGGRARLAPADMRGGRQLNPTP